MFHTSATRPGLPLPSPVPGWRHRRRDELVWRQRSTCLGGAFHSRRLKLVSSQVGHVAATRRPRWNYGRRIGLAMRLLAQPELDALVAEEIAF